MHVRARDLADAFGAIVSGIYHGDLETVPEPSRNGPVIRIAEPVTVTYREPRSRVLLHRGRDCNPFFHLYEALWMLNGQRDVESLAYYNSRMAEFSDDGEIFNGAYGWRWRNLGAINQLEAIINLLRHKPETRRAVLQMWRAFDLVDSQTGRESKDVPCNLCCCFELVNTPNIELNMTVFNRSNDLVLGMLGANYVHFTFLQEYIANCLGVGVGKYNHVTNNLHVYTEGKWDPTWGEEHVRREAVCPWALVKDQETFDKELEQFCDTYFHYEHYTEPFLENVARPMMNAFYMHKRREYGSAFGIANDVQADDWRTAAMEWLVKRRSGWEKKEKLESSSKGSE